MAPRDSILRVEAAVAAAGATLRQRGANIYRSHGYCHNGDDPETLAWLYSQDRGHTNPHCHKHCDRELILGAFGLTEADLYDEPRKKGGNSMTIWTPAPRVAPRPKPARVVFEPAPRGWRPAPETVTRCPVDGGYEMHELAAEYLYADEDSRIVFGVRRCVHKHFNQWRPDPTWRGARRPGTREYDKQTKDVIGIVKSVPYRLPLVLNAIRDEQVVWIAEGEKDVNTLTAAGLVATCCAGGSGMGWDPGCNHYFAGADVCIVPDRDAAGRKLAEQIVRELMPVARSIEVVIPKSGNDATDHIDAGHQAWEFVQLWTPKPFGLEVAA